MKRLILKIIYVLIFQLVIIGIVLAGGYFYLLKFSDPQKLENFSSYTVPTYREYGTTDYEKIQKNITDEITETFSKGEWSLEIPYVNINPYGQNNLSAYVGITTDQPVKYSYIVSGKTENTNYSHSTNEYEVSPLIPVIGLYNNYDNEVNVILEYEDGTIESEVINIPIYDETIEDEMNANVEIYNEVVANETIYSGWTFTSKGNAYDGNGDLRVSNLFPYRSGFVKIVNGNYYVPYIEESYDQNTYYVKKLYSIDLLGKINPDETIVLPKGYGAHHDLVYGEDGNYYVLGSKQSESVQSGNDDDQKDQDVLEGDIFIYDENYHLIDQINFGENIPGNAPVENDAIPYDVHLNSIDYYNDQLILSARNSSVIYCYDLRTKEINWVIGEDSSMYEEIQDKKLTPIGNITYPRGQHSVKVTKEIDEETIELTLFNNNAVAIDATGETKKQFIEEVPDYNLMNNNSSIIQYQINTTDLTIIETLDFEINGYSPYTSNVSIINDNFVIYLGYPGDLIITDEDGNEEVKMEMPYDITDYRGMIFDYETINSLL